MAGFSKTNSLSNCLTAGYCYQDGVVGTLLVGSTLIFPRRTYCKCVRFIAGKDLRYARVLPSIALFEGWLQMERKICLPRCSSIVSQD